MESEMIKCADVDPSATAGHHSDSTCPTKPVETADDDFIVLDEQDVAGIENSKSARISSEAVIDIVTVSTQGAGEAMSDVTTDKAVNGTLTGEASEPILRDESLISLAPDVVVQDESRTNLASEPVCQDEAGTTEDSGVVQDEILTALADMGESLMVVDEWEDEETLKEAERKREELEDNANIDERNILTMPSFSTIVHNIEREERFVIVHPLSMSDMNHPEYLKVSSMDSCINIKMHFLRPKDDDTTWMGIATLHFISRDDAHAVASALKQVGSHIKTSIEYKPTDCARYMEKWEKTEQFQDKLIESTMLLVQNVPEGTLVSQLKEFFPDAKNIVINFPRTSSSSSSSRCRSSDPPASKEGVAYVVFRTSEACKESADKYLRVRPEVNGRRLKVYAYREPAKLIPACLLSLSERRTVLLLEERLKNDLETAKKEDPNAKLKSSAERELRQCERVLERDDRTRKHLGVQSYTLEELNVLEKLPALTEEETKELMKRTNIVDDRERSREKSRSRERDRKHDYGHRSDRNRERSRERSRSRRHGDKDESSRRKRTRSSSRTKDGASSDRRSGSRTVTDVKSAKSNGSGDHASCNGRGGGEEEENEEEAVLDFPDVSLATPDVSFDMEQPDAKQPKLDLDEYAVIDDEEVVAEEEEEESDVTKNVDLLGEN